MEPHFGAVTKGLKALEFNTLELEHEVIYPSMQVAKNLRKPELGRARGSDFYDRGELGKSKDAGYEIEGHFFQGHN
jgi:hypothetical protein